MKFKRRATEYSLLDRRRNGYILEEFGMVPIENKLAQYKQYWSDQITRAKHSRHPKQILNKWLVRKLRVVFEKSEVFGVSVWRPV
jgi:hypothetical protein